MLQNVPSIATAALRAHLQVCSATPALSNVASSARAYNPSTRARAHTRFIAAYTLERGMATAVVGATLSTPLSLYKRNFTLFLTPCCLIPLYYRGQNEANTFVPCREVVPNFEPGVVREEAL